MIMFRWMGAAHLIAGVVLAAASSMNLDDSISSTIVLSQLIGGAVMLAVGLKFKI